MLRTRSTPGSFLRAMLIVISAIALSGCIVELEDEFNPAGTGDITVGGSVGDGPVTGATVTVFNASGDIINTLVSDSQARFSVRIKARGNEYPLRLEATGGTDLVTGREPDFRMVSVITQPSFKTANINPFSTLIVKVAEQLPGGLNTGNVQVQDLGNSVIQVTVTYPYSGLLGGNLPSFGFGANADTGFNLQATVSMRAL